nr:hypothetical protein CFP56_74757 [Quercus suber]
MESRRDTKLRRDLPYFTGIMNGDIEIDSQFLGMSQNTLVSVSDSPPPPQPQVENAFSTKGKRGSNFSVEEDQLLLCMAKVNARHQSGITEQDKDQPKFADPNGRSRASVPLTPESTSIGEGDCGSELGDTSNFKMPIGRKAEKAIRKNNAIRKDV